MSIRTACIFVVSVMVGLMIISVFCLILYLLYLIKEAHNNKFDARGIPLEIKPKKNDSIKANNKRKDV